jgi:acetyltransferase-like isoleucine patch superfamily enzyme
MGLPEHLEDTAAASVAALTPLRCGTAPDRTRGFRGAARESLKALGRVAAAVLVIPFLVSYAVGAFVLGRDRALENTTEYLALVPGLSGQYLRRAFLARVLLRCHRTAFIGFGTVFSRVDARIDENVYIGPRCHIGSAYIGRDALLAAGIHITSGARMHGTADVSIPIREQPGVWAQVRIGAGVWIGSNAVVMADVGRDTIVGAGAVVTRPLPDAVVAAGVPARVLRSRKTGEAEGKA